MKKTSQPLPLPLAPSAEPNFQYFFLKHAAAIEKSLMTLSHTATVIDQGTNLEKRTLAFLKRAHGLLSSVSAALAHNKLKGRKTK